jgi:hypothetical protein
MKRTNQYESHRKWRTMALLLCLPIPGIGVAATNPDLETDMSQQDQPPPTQTFAIKSKSEFACAEVAPDRSGGQVSHEIVLSPRSIERCLLVKVGSRLHECIDLKIEKATVDPTGVVRIDTDEGAVNFWFEEAARVNTAEEKGTLVFTWPDNDRKYLCAGFRK